MTGAGNDIVALAVINATRTLQPNFYSKIILPAERDLYTPAFEFKLPFEHFVWLAWSVKESAYKFLKRFDTQLVFSPSQIIITDLIFSDGYFAGTIRSGNCLLYSRSFINNDYIFSVVDRQNDFSDMHYGIKQIDSCEPGDQSREVRELFLDKLRQSFPGSSLQIMKSLYGWPVIIIDGEESPIPVSFTHHGYFVAYTFQSSHTLWKMHQLHAEAL